MKKYLPILITILILGVFALPHSAYAAGTTYYIDYATGNDSNNGTSKVTPWKDQPYMPAFTGTYTHQIGDQFIFKGGITWPQPAMDILAGGSSGSPDYYGVDKTWFTGAFWTQPVFDDQNSSTAITYGSQFFIGVESNASYVTIDNFHFTNFYWKGDPSFSGSKYIGIVAATNVTVENSLFDNWSHDTAANGTTDSSKVILIVNTQNYLLLNNTFDQSTNPSLGDSGWALYGSNSGGTIQGNTCYNTQECFVPVGTSFTLTGNTVYNIGIVSDFDSGTHPNAIEVFGSSSIINNNIIHDIGYGVEVIDWENVGNNYLYNNVIWNTNVGFSSSYPDLTLDCDSGTCPTGASYVFNNTFDAPIGTCLRAELRAVTTTYGTLNMTNNLCIGGSLYSLDAGVTITNFSTVTNSTITTGTAAADGYTIANQFQPTSASNPTVGTGTNLTSYCSTISSLCADILSISHPSIWDIGAYQFVGFLQSVIKGLSSWVGNFIIQ